MKHVKSLRAALMIRTSITFFILALIALVLPTACSSMNKEADRVAATPSRAERAAANDLGAARVVEVSFEQGSDSLAEDARNVLRDLVSRSKAAGKIDELKVLAWSDVDYPNEARGTLSSEDRNLANRRAASIREFVRSELGVNDVETHNMAQRPNALQELFNTSDARIKEAFENAGVTSSEGRAMKRNASHALVMAMLED